MWCFILRRIIALRTNVGKSIAGHKDQIKIGETKVNIQRYKERHIHQLVINRLEKITLKDHPLNSTEKKWIN